MDARKFFFVCAGILCLVAAYQLGSRRVEAQPGTAQFAGVTFDVASQVTIAITTTGDLYMRGGVPNVYTCDGSWGGDHPDCGWTYAGNVLGGPISVQSQSFGKTKAKSR